MSLIKSNLKKVFAIVLLAIGSLSSVHAQVPPDPGPPENPPVPDDNPVPITGIEYLIISGGILGGYKLYKSKRKNND